MRTEGASWLKSAARAHPFRLRNRAPTGQSRDDNSSGSPSWPTPGPDPPGAGDRLKWGQPERWPGSVPDQAQERKILWRGPVNFCGPPEDGETNKNNSKPGQPPIAQAPKAAAASKGTKDQLKPHTTQDKLDCGIPVDWWGGDSGLPKP